MHPIRISPGRGLLSVSAYEFRESDIGPYNEVSISVPFTLDVATPMFTGILRKGPAEPRTYIHHLPVTTEIARAAGVELGSYPKFLAHIDFERESGWVTCRLAEGEQHILTLVGRELDTRPAPRSRAHAFTARDGRLLRSEVISSERGLAMSSDASDARLELGDHPISKELEGLSIGRVLSYQYAPEYQTILMPVIESFAI